MIERFGHGKLRLVECPVCHADLRGRKTAHHVQEHTPTDFGLTPKGEIQ